MLNINLAELIFTLVLHTCSTLPRLYCCLDLSSKMIYSWIFWCPLLSSTSWKVNSKKMLFSIHMLQMYVSSSQSQCSSLTEITSTTLAQIYLLHQLKYHMTDTITDQVQGIILRDKCTELQLLEISPAVCPLIPSTSFLSMQCLLCH